MQHRRFRDITSRARLLSALTLAGTFATGAHAQTWDGGGVAGGSVGWNTAANWNPDGVPANNGTASIIMAGTIDTTNTVDVNFDINGLQFNNTAGAFVVNNSGGASLTLRGGGILNNDTQGQTLNVPLVLAANQAWSAAVGSLTINGSVNLGGNQLNFDTPTQPCILAGNIAATSGSIAKFGANQLSISGNNAFTGGVILNAGTLVAITDTAFGTGTLTINGGVLHSSFAGGTRTLANAVTINADFATQGSSALLLTGATTLTGDRTITVSTSPTSTTFSGAIGQDAAGRQFIKSGTGTLVLSGASANTYTGATVVNSGILQLNKAPGITAVAGDLVIGDNVGGANADQVLLLANNQIADAATVTVNITGLLNIGGASETISSLVLAGGLVSGSGSLAVTSQIVLDATANVSSSISAPINLDGGTVTVDVADTPGAIDLGIDSAISSGSLTKTGPGTLRFAGPNANNYTGTTTVNAGTLQLGKTGGVNAVAGPLTIGSASVVLENNNQIADGVTVNILGGTLDVGSSTDIIGGLTMTGGLVTGAATLGLPGNVTTSAAATSATIATPLGLGGGTRTYTVADGAAAADLVVTGAFAAGTIIKSGTGAMRLGGTGNNFFSGTVTVNGGTLLLAKPAGSNAVNTSLTIGDGVGGADADVVRHEASDQIPGGATIVTVNSSGLLDLNGFSETLSDLTLSGGRVSGGTISVTNSLSTLAQSASAVIDASYDLLAVSETFTVADGAASDDLVISGVIQNGTFVKSGAGALKLSGSTPNTANLFRVAAGTVVMEKDAGVNAVGGSQVIIGDSAGGAQSDVLRYGANDNQLADTIDINMSSTGLFDLNGRSDTIGSLLLTGGSVVQTGAGTLTVAGTISSAAAATAGAINGNLNLSGNRTFSVPNGAAPTDLNVTAAMSNGTLVKQGDGTLGLSGGALTSAVSYQLDDGTISANGLIVGPAHVFTQNAGAFSGTLNNQGNFVYNGGTFNGTLINNGTATFNVDFTAGTAIVNHTTLVVGTGATLTADASGFDNQGTFELAGGTLAGNGPLHNNALLTGRGTIAGTGGFANFGLLSISGGNLTISNSGVNANQGNLDLAPGLQLRLEGGQLLNSATINLNAGTVAGIATLNNAAGGTVVGRGAITAPLTNNGTLMPQGGTLNVSTNFTNGGTILLGGTPASLIGGTVTNNGVIRGDGTISNTVIPNSAGEIRAESGNSLLFVNTIGPNNGKFNLLGGTLQFNQPVINNPAGLITGRGTLIVGGTGLTNDGQVQLSAGFTDVYGDVVSNSGSKIIVSGGGTSTFYDDVDMNSGSEFRVSTGATAVFFGNVSGSSFFTGSGTKIFEDGNSVLSELATGTGSTVVEASATLTANQINENGLTVNGLAVISEMSPSGYDPGNNLYPSGSNANGSIVKSLAVNGAGQLDLGNSDMVIDHDGSLDLHDVRELIGSGYNFGGQDGPGIISTTALNTDPFTFALGYADNASLPLPYGTVLGGGPFSSQDPDDTAALIKFTWVGDVTLDGIFDFQDLSIFNGNYDAGATTGRVWTEGDLNYDGTIDFQDLSLFNGSYDPAKPSLPEPGALAAVCGAAVLLVQRRRDERELRRHVR